MRSGFTALGLIFAIFSVATASDVVCRFRAGTMQTYDDMSACIKSIPFSQSVADQTLAAVSQLLEMNVFKDVLLSPPSPFEYLATDLSAEVQALKATPMTTDYELQQGISNIFIALKDPHSVYAKPACYRNFGFALPFGLTAALEDGEQVIRLSNLPAAQQFLSYQYIAAHPEAATYLGKRVLAIGFNGTVPMEDPLEVIRRWADINCYISKSASARFNRAVKGDFFLRTQTIFGIPEHPTMALELEGVGRVVLPWLGYSQADLFSAADMAALCPAASSAANGPAPAPAHPALSPAATPMARFLAEVQGPAPAHTTEEDMNEATPDLRRLFISAYIEAYVYQHNSTNTTTDPAVPTTALLRIPSFSPDTIPHFVDALIAAMKAIAAAGPERLLIDVRSNGGGYVSLGYNTVKYLAPRIYPLSGEYNVRHNAITDALLHAAFSNEQRYDYLSHTVIPGDNWYNPGVSRSFQDMSGSSFNHTYSGSYTFDVADDEGDAGAAYAKLAANPSPVIFDPQHMAVITDGLCGSTCSCFAKRIQESHAAKMIGVGGVWHNGMPPSGPFDVSSFAGGSVLDSLFLDEQRAALSPSDPALKTLPPVFPRNGYLRFAFEEVFSWNWTTRARGTPLEFNVNPADWVIPVWPSTDAGDASPQLLTQIFRRSAAYFDTCAPWEVKYDAACPIAHGRGGRPCDAAGEFDMNSCRILDCDTGYYRNAEDLCVIIPPAAPTGLVVPWWVWLAIGGALVTIVLVVVGIVCCCKRRHNEYQPLGLVAPPPPASV